MIRLLLPLVAFVVCTEVASLFMRRAQPLSSARMSIVILVLGMCTSVPILIHLSVTWLFGVPDLGAALHRLLLGGQMHVMDRNFLGLAALVFLAVSTVRSGRILIRERRLRNQVGDGIMIVPDNDVYAYALPGPKTKVVVSAGLVRGLTQNELDVVVAHEMAHVTNRHDRLLLVGRICAIFNPFLTLSAKRLRFSLERIADQAAVHQCGDSRHVARTIAKVALGHSDTHFALGIASYGVLDRIESLTVQKTSSPDRMNAMSVAYLFGLSLLMFVQWHHVIDAIAVACGR